MARASHFVQTSGAGRVGGPGGGASSSTSRRAPRLRSTSPRSRRRRWATQFVGTEHLLLASFSRARARGAPCCVTSGVTRGVAPAGAGPGRATGVDYEGQATGESMLEKYTRDLTAMAREGQARPGHRARRGDQARHPGALPAHQEQPRAHRRARRGQDGHRRGPGAEDRRRRRARVAARQARAGASTWAAWSPAPSTAASSRSASRACSTRSARPRT